MEKFEYKVINTEMKIKMFNTNDMPETFEKELNDLGALGWEVVCVIPRTTSHGEISNFTTILKRNKKTF